MAAVLTCDFLVTLMCPNGDRDLTLENGTDAMCLPCFENPQLRLARHPRERHYDRKGDEKF